MRVDARGFTLVEMVVTIIVVSILAVTVLPRFDVLKGFDEVGYADKVRATIEFARKAAVAQRRYTCLAMSGGKFTLTRDLRDPDAVASPSCTSTLALPAPDTQYCGSATAGNEICAPSGITVSGTASFNFSPLGRPSAAASYTITGQSAAAVTVEAETGYVH